MNDLHSFKETVSHGNFLVKFTASWCKPCKKLQESIDSTKLSDWNTKLIIVDVDDNENITDYYQVSLLPTLLFIKNEKILCRKEGIISKEEIEALLNVHHPKE